MLGGTVRHNTDPAAVSNSDGRLEVFVVAADNGLWHRWHTTSDGILPAIEDPNLTVERFVDGLSSPTSATFLDSNTILVLEKSGNVRLVSNGQLQSQPILQIPVNTQSGM
jgi:glucose/arabinose dehydrogenase